MEGKKILSIGLIIFIITIIIDKMFKLPDILYLMLFLFAIVLEITGMIRMKKTINIFKRSERVWI